MRAGIWLWMMKLHVASRLGMMAPNPAHSWVKFPLKYLFYSYSEPHLLDEVHELLLGSVARDEVVDVGHDVHADVAGQVVLGPGPGEAGGRQGEAHTGQHQILRHRGI